MGAARVQFTDYYDPIPLSSLLKVFGDSSDGTQLPSESQEILNEVFSICRDRLAMVISPRVELAISRYCQVGAKLFTGTETIVPDIIAVDFAIAQKILPKVQGNGSEYRKTLEDLYNIMLRDNLVKSAELLKRIIRSGDLNMQFYQFFA